MLLAPEYVRIYQVEPQVRELTRQILVAFAIVAPVKVQNMILGGGREAIDLDRFIPEKNLDGAVIRR